MAVNTELVRIDNVEKELWDKIVESAGSSSTGGVLVVNAVYDEATDVRTLDKTWKEIHDADYAVLKSDTPTGNIVVPLTQFTSGDPYFAVVGVSALPGGATLDHVYITQSENGYPTEVVDEPGGKS